MSPTDPTRSGVKKLMKADDLREAYLAFFESKGCIRRPSDVLVPRWDPSVLFTPAGMNQFKDHFLGKCKLDFTQATSCQKKNLAHPECTEALSGSPSLSRRA